MWHYIEDETVTITFGEVFITAEEGSGMSARPRRHGIFPAGTSCEWHVNNRVRKVAVFRKNIGFPLGFGVRAWYKALTIAGLRGRSPL